MMRSLWSGVTGLQAHQIAMDVEGHNIANVNTIGFKSNRANFADLMSQGLKVATGAQGKSGGKNPMQIGLGTQANSTTRIFKQGSIKTTEKQTDLSIQGDGFFIVSPDGGRSQRYTRNGDFIRDNTGNFVDNNGYIVQGWMRNEDTGLIDSTSPIENIRIKPGLTTPANPTSSIALKANLDSGNTVGNKISPILSLDSKHNWIDKDGNDIQTDFETHNENDIYDNEFYTNKKGEQKLRERGIDMGVIFDGGGEAIGLRKGQGVWISYTDARTTPTTITIPNNTAKLDITLNGTEITANVSNLDEVVSNINSKTQITGVEAQIINGNQLVLVNQNRIGTTVNQKNIKMVVKSTNSVNGISNIAKPKEYQPGDILSGGDTLAGFVQGPGQVNRQYPAGTFTNNTGRNIVIKGEYLVGGQDIVIQNGQDNPQFELKPNMDFKIPDEWNDGGGVAVKTAFSTDTKELKVITAYQYTYMPGNAANANTYDASRARQFTTTEDLRHTMQKDARLYVDYSGDGVADKNDGVKVTVNDKGQFQIENPIGDAHNEDDLDIVDQSTKLVLAGAKINKEITLGPKIYEAGTFRNTTGNPITIPGIVNGKQITRDGQDVTIPANGVSPQFELVENFKIPDTWNDDVEATVDFKYNLKSERKDIDNNDFNLNLSVTGLTDDRNGVGENTKFRLAMGGLQGSLSSGTSMKTSQSLNVASHGTSTKIYDSLGSEHDVKMEFFKIGFTPNGGTEWSVTIQVPEPGVLNLSGQKPDNVVTGVIKFNPDGSLSTFTPSSITFTPNNGSESGQNIELNFGRPNDFDGITSYDNDSQTGNISQNGYPGGELDGLRINEFGVIVGTFTNSIHLELGQIALAKFTNNEGLEADGGNVFLRTSNSGEPVIGTAQTAGRGKISASTLEMSNVDLSRSLTELIVIQRGYQANSKTITTSDQMLNTLLQLKQ